MRALMIAAATALALSVPAVSAPAEAGSLRFSLSAPAAPVTQVGGRHGGQFRSFRGSRHASRSFHSGRRYGYSTPRRFRGNGPQSFGYRNLSGRFTPRFNTTGRRVNSLLRF